jgi:hypothetical protein
MSIYELCVEQLLSVCTLNLEVAMNSLEMLLLIGAFLFALYVTVHVFMRGQYKEQEKRDEEHDSTHNVQDPPP